MQSNFNHWNETALRASEVEAMNPAGLAGFCCLQWCCPGCSLTEREGPGQSRQDITDSNSAGSFDRHRFDRDGRICLR